MANTSTFSVDNVGNPEPVIVNTTCSEVTIGEDGQVGTSDFKVRRPLMTSVPVTYAAGKKVTFVAGFGKFFNQGDIIAYVETVSGTLTFSQEEQ